MADTPFQLTVNDIFTLQIANYLAASVVSAWCWDLIISSPDEISIFAKHRFTLPDIIYILARVSTGGFLGASLAFIAAGDEYKCAAVGQVICWFGAIALPLNSFLFFLRAQAVFRHAPIVCSIFAVLWLSTLGAFTQPFDSTAIRVPGDICITVDVNRLSSVGFITVASFDTIVFITISIRLVCYGFADSFKGRFKSFLNGCEMGRISRAILQTGQLYYLATVGVNIFCVVVLLKSAFSPAIRATLTMPNVALQNAMVCRVYRLLKMGLIEEDVSVFRTSQPQRFGDFKSGPDVQFASIKTNLVDREEGTTYVDSLGLMELSGQGTYVEGAASSKMIPHSDFESKVRAIDVPTESYRFK